MSPAHPIAPVRPRRPRSATRAATGTVLALGALVAAPGLHAQAARGDDEPNRQDRVETIDVDSEARLGFRAGSRLRVKPRSYYLDRDRDSGADSVAWALGGALEYRSGWAWDRLQLAGSVFTSQKLYGPADEDGTRLLKPGQEGFTVLGEAHLTLRLGAGNGIRAGRQTFDLPYLARQDVRMAPHTFEAIAVGRPVAQGFGYIAGYVDRFKGNDADRFVPMSVAAGAPGSDEGLGLLAAQYVFEDGSLVGATQQTSFDVMRTLFVKAEKSFALGGDASVRGHVQYTDQRSSGEALIGTFATHLAAFKLELSLPSTSMRIAHSRAGCCMGLQSPFGGSPNYLSIIVDNFDRAGEDAWLVGMSHDFSALGAPGLAAFWNVSRGDTPDVGLHASPDETEYDLTLDYRFGEQHPLGGLALRVRGAWVDQDEALGGVDFLDFRVIANYTFDLP